MEDKYYIFNSGLSSFPLPVIDVLIKKRKAPQLLSSRVYFLDSTLRDAIYT